MRSLIGYFLISTASLFSQNLEKLKEQDTVYFYFDYGEHEKKSMYGIMNRDKNPDTLYAYTFTKGKEYLKTIKLRRQIYFDLDDMINDKRGDVKILKKKFLQKNKKQIITIDFLLKYGFRETFYSIWQRTKVYLIDSKDSSKGKIVAREVLLDGEPYMSEADNFIEH